jgi:DNA-binding CsgD family transcriptional regulator/tetratricopeptide (TPR) repeat protein
LGDDIIGRDPELARLDALLDGLPAGGGALVLHGDAGVGKSTLLARAAAAAARRGVPTVTVTGVQAEFDLAYAGLHLLISRLPMPDGTADARAVVLAALDSEASPVRVALALLTLLTEDAPMVVLADDAQWLDGSSWDALTFVARRLSSDPVLILMAMRAGDRTTTRLARAGLPELSVEPLAAPAAAALLDRQAPALRADLRERILAEAAGNPLGLIELGAAGDRYGRLPVHLPLPMRLERTFALAIDDLPPATRLLLLVAAVDDGTALEEIVGAAAALGEETVAADDVRPAVGAGLVEVDEQAQIRFRHPLVRSALRQQAGPSRRRAIHAALGTVIAKDDERRIWHRSEAADGPDEALATELAAVALRGRRRGTYVQAVAGLERAAELSADPNAQATRLFWAAISAYDVGDTEEAARLLHRLADRRLQAADQARLVLLREVVLANTWSGAGQLDTFVGILDRMRRDGEPEPALDELASIGMRYFWSNPDAPTRARAVAVADRFEVSPDDPRLTSALAQIAPLERGEDVLDGIRRRGDRLTGTAEELSLLATATASVGAFDRSLTYAAASADGYRAQGLLGPLTQILVTQGAAAAQVGDARQAETTSAEAYALAVETGQPRWALSADLVRGQAAALRGDSATARELADGCGSVLMSIGAHPMLARVEQNRGLEALAGGRYTEAYEHLVPIFDPAAVPYHPVVRFWALSYLVDAAIGGGRNAELRALLDGLPALRFPVLRVAVNCAEALLAPGDDTFTAALARDELTVWPFERARLQHAYGSWLRRQRRVNESRVHLRAATTTLDGLGLRPWADRARAELRATGESEPRPSDARDRLSPQESQIAQLAADGLSNREIGERLFLSPRTVGSHLYRIFPKLGITSRVELARLFTP